MWLAGSTPGRLPYVNLFVIGYAHRVRTPASGPRAFVQVMPPRGASRPQEPRPTSPPRGSGAAAPSGALRAIDPCGTAAFLADLRSAPPAAAIPTCPGATQG